MKQPINEIRRMQQLAGIINESQLDEISPELARSAFDSSLKYFNDNPNASDTDKLTYQKKVSQANTFAKHVNPNNIETANKIAKLIDVDYRAEIKKNVFDGGNEQQVRVYFGGRSANIIITIRKNDYKINTDVSLSEPVERRLITFIKQIQNTELVDAPIDTQEL